MKQRTLNLLVIGVCLGVLISAGLLWQKRPESLKNLTTVDLSGTPQITHQPDNPDSATSDLKANNRVSPSTPVISAQTPSEYDAGKFAPSLAGTDIDGRLATDGAGKLIISLEVKDFFDYFFNTVGEVSPEQALAEIERLASSSLPPEAVAEAMEILDQYLAYKEAAVAIMSKPLKPAAEQTPEYHLQILSSSFASLKQIRR